jgi:hypothetical protein
MTAMTVAATCPLPMAVLPVALSQKNWLRAGFGWQEWQGYQKPIKSIGATAKPLLEHPRKALETRSSVALLDPYGCRLVIRR